MIQQARQAIRETIASLFKDHEGKPYHLTDGQCDIFMAVTNPQYKWVWTSAPTRYGKSEVLAIALLYLAVFERLKIPIVGGSQEKANKIMDYILQHISDNPILYTGLINANFDKIDKLKIQASKEVLRWSNGGWIFVTSIDSRSISKEGEGVVGEGGDVVVLEEAGLIKRKEQFSKVVRMSEDDRGWGKLIMSGNCVENSVFETAYKDPMYYKVRIDLDQAIREGRFTQSSLDQKKLQTTSKDWKRYYLVMFPASNEFTYFKPRKYEYLPTELEYFGGLDPALGEAKKGSLIGIVVLGRDPMTGQLYEIESSGEHIKPEETMRTIFNMPYAFQRFGIETVMFQKYFFQEVEKKSKLEKRNIPFDAISQSKNKMERIESLEPSIATGQILFKGDNELWDEMQDYPECDNFDVLDALEIAYRVAGGSGFDFSIV